MRTDRRWFWKALILLAFPLVLALTGATGDDDHKETKYRWDIVKITSFNPATAVEGGFASALANDGSRITVTGNGTFEPGEADEVTGGGTWTTFAPGGTTVTGNGTYRVQRLVRFDLAPGFLNANFIDNIPGAKGDLTDARAGLLFVRIAYSDGSKGVLVVSCNLGGGPDFVARPPSPASIFEGITASKGYVDYWSRVPPIGAPVPMDGNRTLFHAIHQAENPELE
ncbi:MAG: hypothetical protein NVSMB62_11350 [Acidobacteriaceae bacterium]